MLKFLRLRGYVRVRLCVRMCVCVQRYVIPIRLSVPSLRRVMTTNEKRASNDDFKLKVDEGQSYRLS